MQTEKYIQVEYDVIEHGPIRYIYFSYLHIDNRHTDTGQGVTRPPWRMRAAWPPPRPRPGHPRQRAAGAVARDPAAERRLHRGVLPRHGAQVGRYLNV